MPLTLPDLTFRLLTVIEEECSATEQQASNDVEFELHRKLYVLTNS